MYPIPCGKDQIVVKSIENKLTKANEIITE